MSNDLYDRDFYAWANQQAALLRAGRLAEADIENIAEEIESMGRSEKRELVSRLTILLQHLLKWQFQPEKRSNSWRAGIREQRVRIARILKASPSLKAYPAQSLPGSFIIGLDAAIAETGLAPSALPVACPYSVEQVLDDDFWPGHAP